MKNVWCFIFVVALIFKADAQDHHSYFGNIHAHFAFSDGNKDSLSSHVMTTAQCYQFAERSAHFDLLGISEHNHSQAKMHLPNYAKGLAAANANKKCTDELGIVPAKPGFYPQRHQIETKYTGYRSYFGETDEQEAAVLRYVPLKKNFE